ncbi:MAG: alpha/beta hydrolase [Bacteriovorax sp.]
MIQLTKVKSNIENAPNLILIPGGPGLSSLTLRSLDILSRSFNLFYVDFPGTNDNPYIEKKNFDELSNELVVEIQAIKGPKFVLGHSYGGFFAADLSLKVKLNGVICVATPFSEKSLVAASENYNAKKSQVLSDAEDVWEKLQDDKSLAKWLSEYGELYFIKPEGRDLLLQDKVSALFFMAYRSDAIQKESMLPLLKQNGTKKLFVAGKRDGMLPEAILKEDASRGGFSFISVNNASHFVTFDQPESVAGLIEDFMRQK